MTRPSLIAFACVFAVACSSKSKDEPIEVDDTPVVHADFPKSPPKGCGGGFYSYHYGEALKTLREVEDYKAGKRDYYVRELSDRRNEYLLAGISPTFRVEWLSSHRTAEKDQHCIVPVFEAIGAAAKRTLPKFHPRGYLNHDSSEEELIKKAVKAELGDAEFLGVGIKSDTWMIEKNYSGVPSSRYKYGMAWVKSATLDDGYCRIMYVNIVQDYAGGGNYADSVANYIQQEPAGCK